MADAFLRQLDVVQVSRDASEEAVNLKSTGSKRTLQKRDSGYLSPGITPGVTPDAATTPSKSKSLHLEVQPAVRPLANPFLPSALEMPVPQDKQEQQLPESGKSIMKPTPIRQSSTPLFENPGEAEVS